MPINFSDEFVFNEKSYITRNEIIDYFRNNFSSDDFIVLDDMPLFPDGIHLDYLGHEKVSDVVLEVIKNG